MFLICLSPLTSMLSNCITWCSEVLVSLSSYMPSEFRKQRQWSNSNACWINIKAKRRIYYSVLKEFYMVFNGKRIYNKWTQIWKMHMLPFLSVGRPNSKHHMFHFMGEKKRKKAALNDDNYIVIWHNLV